MQTRRKDQNTRRFLRPIDANPLPKLPRYQSAASLAIRKYGRGRKIARHPPLRLSPPDRAQLHNLCNVLIDVPHTRWPTEGCVESVRGVAGCVYIGGGFHDQDQAPA